MGWGMCTAKPRPLDLTHPDNDARFGVELRTVAASARRRAGRDGDRQIDTAHLLHSLLETDPRAREACDAGSGQVVRVLGYLAQRSIGYGLEWQGSVEDSGALPVVTARSTPGWSPAAAAAMRTAVRSAQRGGRGQADGIDLLNALAADPHSRAVEVLRTAGLDVSRYLDEGPVAS